MISQAFHFTRSSNGKHQRSNTQQIIANPMQCFIVCCLPTMFSYLPLICINCDVILLLQPQACILYCVFLDASPHLHSSIFWNGCTTLDSLQSPFWFTLPMLCRIGCQLLYCKQIMNVWALNPCKSVIRLPVKTDVRLHGAFGRICLPLWVFGYHNSRLALLAVPTCF